MQLQLLSWLRTFLLDLLLILPISVTLIIIYTDVFQFVGILASIMIGISTLIFAITNAYRRTGRILPITLLSIAVFFLIIAMAINLQVEMVHSSILDSVRYVLYLIGAGFLSLFLLTSLVFRKKKFEKTKNIESSIGRFVGALGATLGNAMCMCLTPAGILALLPIPFMTIYQVQVGFILVTAAFSHELQNLILH